MHVTRLFPPLLLFKTRSRVLYRIASIWIRPFDIQIFNRNLDNPAHRICHNAGPKPGHPSRSCKPAAVRMPMGMPSKLTAIEQQHHVHLLSTYRYPSLQQVHPEKIAEWLLNAPKITRDQAPFYWTYLDKPVDGSILLVWQSSSIGTNFPSDGYVWAPPENRYQIDVQSTGYSLEMFHHRIGYAPGEHVAAHSRRRYRLNPPRDPNANVPAPDMSLWIVHYMQAEMNERVPSNLIPIDMHERTIQNTRNYLHQQGQIVQKEFMLHDRANWPQIAFPRNAGNAARSAPAYGGNLQRAGVPPAMAYTQQGPPSKRPRTQPPSQLPGPSIPVDADDEEDTQRGDFFDHTTPREISMSRYKQNHEWMEEILSSPYAINQLIPADLGLGLVGQFASLTEGIFDAPLDPEKDQTKHNYVGHLDKEKAEEFRKRANESIAQTNRGIEKMKAKHAKRLAKLQKGSLVSQAEKELRSAVNDPIDVGPEYWRLEGRVDTEDEEEGKPEPKAPSKVADIISQVEASVGRHAAAVQELVRIQDGGYEEPAAVPSPEVPAVPSPQATPPGSNNGSSNSGVLVGEADMDMGGSAVGLLDQFHTGVSSNATPGSNFPTPQAHLQATSAAGTPNNIPTPSSQPTAEQTIQTDVTMGDGATTGEQAHQPDENTKDDWIVVPPGGVSPTASAQVAPPITSQAPELGATTISTPSAPVLADPSPLPTTSSNQTPLPDFHTSPNDFADLGDLDTAGEALAGYGDELGDSGGDLGDLGMEMDVGMDDSAFGEAFHGIEPSGEDNGEGDGL
ncbi:SWI/SNF and RSC complexes subunit ssr4 [Lachnellula suecica]|uniref:SWI/SNF and RSC complexes subunit ssr4 n=1 Tax=Lachnellula suecica TaxID=602035 RepID=A0A8T9CAM9_9HELO|nr:SWI/SNF and RSC complexes subunit ssr4 [Lachnellula suecica]